MAFCKYLCSKMRNITIDCLMEDAQKLNLMMTNTKSHVILQSKHKFQYSITYLNAKSIAVTMCLWASDEIMLLFQNKNE